MDHLGARKRQGSDHSEDTSSSESEEVEEGTSSSEELEGALDQGGGILKASDHYQKRFFSLMNRGVTARDTSGRKNVLNDPFSTITGIQELFIAPIIENSMPGLLQLNTAPERPDVLIVSLKQPRVADEQYQPKLELFWFLYTVNVRFGRILASEVVKHLMRASVPPSNAEHEKIDCNFSSEDDCIYIRNIVTTADIHLLAPFSTMVISTFFRDAWLQHLLGMEYGWEVRYKHGATVEWMEVQLSVPSATVDMLVQPPHDDRHGSVVLSPKFKRNYPIDHSDRLLVLLLAECRDKGFIRIEPYDTHSDAARVVDTLKVLLL